MSESQTGSPGRTAVYVGVSLAVVGLALGLWYFLALRSFGAVSRLAGQTVDELAALRDAVFDSDGAPRKEISFDAAEKYRFGFDERKPRLVRIVGQLERGDGMGFWLPDRRRRLAETLRDRVAREEVSAALVRSALDTVRVLNGEAVSALSAGRASRSSAVQALTPEADVETFASQEARLSQAAHALLSPRRKVAAAGKKPDLVDQAELLRVALVNGIGRSLEEEARALRDREAATARARKKLLDYKESMAEMLASTSDFLSGLNSLGQTLLPATRLAYEQTEPLRQLFREAEQPIPGGEMLGAFGGVLTGQGGGTVTPLSIVSSIDPTFRVTVEVLKGVCDGVATAHREVASVVSTTKPLIGPVDDFRASRSRPSMMNLARLAPESARFLQTKATVFDPVLEQIGRGRPYVNAIYESASRIRQRSAQQTIAQCADVASRLLDMAENPFRQGKNAMVQTAAVLEEIGRREREYQTSLHSLQSDPLLRTPKLQAAEAQANADNVITYSEGRRSENSSTPEAVDSGTTASRGGSMAGRTSVDQENTDSGPRPVSGKALVPNADLAAETGARIGPWSVPDELRFLSERRVDVSELTGLPIRDLRLLRNFVYARHGRPFSNAQLRRFFEAQLWYVADSAYTDSRLSAIELANISTIKRVEGARE